MYIEKFKSVLDEMYKLSADKTSDYGDTTYHKYGMKMRFCDIWRKFSRLENLLWFDNKRKVSDESIRDTLMDLACYSVMAIVVFDEEQSSKKG
jgi:hypothetical protein